MIGDCRKERKRMGVEMSVMNVAVIDFGYMPAAGKPCQKKASSCSAYLVSKKGLVV